MRKVFSINTTAGKRYSFGVFDDKTGEMLRGASHKDYKTYKGALRAMRR